MKPYLRKFVIIISFIVSVVSSIYLTIFSHNPVINFIPDSIKPSTFGWTVFISIGIASLLVIFYTSLLGLYWFYFFFFQKRSLKFDILILISFIIIFSFIGGSIYTGYRNEKEKINRLPTFRASHTPTITGISNWKTYIDEKYYFSFEYPDTWDLFGGNKDYKPPSNIYYLTVTTAGSDYNQNDNQDSLVRHGASLSISIPAVTELSLLEWFDKEKKSELEMLKEQQGVNFDVDYEAKLRQMKVIKVNSYFLIPQHVIYIKNKNFIYGLHYNFGSADESELKPIINQILSTFKFIDK